MWPCVKATSPQRHYNHHMIIRPAICMQADALAPVGSEKDTFTALRSTLLHHSKQAADAVAGLQLRLAMAGTIGRDPQVSRLIARLMEILRAQLLTLAQCEEGSPDPRHET